MATIRVKNVSGTDREVPLPDGGYVVVEANHSHEFDADHARSLMDQEEVWTKYEAPKRSTSTRKTAKRKTTTPTAETTPNDAPDAGEDTESDAPADETEQDGE